MHLQGNLGIPEVTKVGYGDVWEEGLKHTPFHQFLKVTGGAPNRARMRNGIFMSNSEVQSFLSVRELAQESCSESGVHRIAFFFSLSHLKLACNLPARKAEHSLM